jgi:branched-chain amino acid transport system permease protein
MLLPTANWGYTIGIVRITWTQIIGFGFGILVTVIVGAFLRYTRLGTAMRALAADREITATLGVPVRRVEAVAWFGSGLIAGAAGLLLSNLVSLDAVTLTFLVISILAAALIARLRSLVVTLAAGLVVGLVSALLVPILTWPNTTYSLSVFHDATPFVLAIVALLWVARRRVVSIGRSGGG